MRDIVHQRTYPHDAGSSWKLTLIVALWASLLCPTCVRGADDAAGVWMLKIECTGGSGSDSVEAMFLAIITNSDYRLTVPASGGDVVFEQLAGGVVQERHELQNISVSGDSVEFEINLDDVNWHFNLNPQGNSIEGPSTIGDGANRLDFYCRGTREGTSGPPPDLIPPWLRDIIAALVGLGMAALIPFILNAFGFSPQSTESTDQDPNSDSNVRPDTLQLLNVDSALIRGSDDNYSLQLTVRYINSTTKPATISGGGNAGAMPFTLPSITAAPHTSTKLLHKNLKLSAGDTVSGTVILTGSTPKDGGVATFNCGAPADPADSSRLKLLSGEVTVVAGQGNLCVLSVTGFYHNSLAGNGTMQAQGNCDGVPLSFSAVPAPPGITSGGWILSIPAPSAAKFSVGITLTGPGKENGGTWNGSCKAPEGCMSAFGNCGVESGVFSNKRRTGSVGEISFQP